MRIKFLSMQMLRFQCLMGNAARAVTTVQRRPRHPPNIIKLIKPDGQITTYDSPIKVSDLTTEYPKHMVCRSDSLYIGQKIPPLSQHDLLQLGHTYFLLPTHFFHSVLSFLTIASFASASSQQLRHRQPPPPPPPPAAVPSSSILVSRDNNIGINNELKIKAAFLKKAAASPCKPFDLQKTPSGSLRIRVSEEFISQLMTDDSRLGKSGTCSTTTKSNSSMNVHTKDDQDQLVAVDSQQQQEDVMSSGLVLCTSLELEKEYKQLVMGRSGPRRWKPKLEMIRETKEKRKVKVLRLISAGSSTIHRSIRKKKKNIKKKSSSQSTSQLMSSLAAPAAAATSTSTKQKKSSHQKRPPQTLKPKAKMK